MNLMKCFKVVTGIVLFFFLFGNVLAVNLYNTDGDFSVSIDDLKKVVSNQDIEASFSFEINNLLDSTQDFEIIIDDQAGWNIGINNSSFSLDAESNEELTLYFVATSEFDYSTAVVGPDEIKITSRDDYKGYFSFPAIIKGDNEEISVTFEVEIIPKDLSFEGSIPSQPVSPQVPFKFSLNSVDAQGEEVFVKVLLDDIILGEFKDSFDSKHYYKIYELNIPTNVDPSTYTGQVLVRFQDNGFAKEWTFEKGVEVLELEVLDINKKTKNTLFTEKISYSIENLGNVKTEFKEEQKVSFFKRLFLSLDQEYTVENGVLSYSIEIEKGEKLKFVQTYNYISLYLILLVVLIVLSYIYIRKNSNPLDVEAKLHEVKRVEHEGVKSMKIKIGFENIKADEIEDLKVVFRMPTYLNVKDDSFLLSEPKKVLRGSNQFKLMWEFKRFERNDSRILGFTLVNKKGILGDIRLPDLELEVTMDGKVRKYYESFPTIRG